MSDVSEFPAVRSDNLVIETLQDEVLIYDLDNEQASCLNSTAALVWKFSDGKSSVQEIAERMSEQLGSPVDARVVWYALEQLDRKHLLSAPLKTRTASGYMTRRDFLVKAGVVGAAVAIPVIISIATPSPALAAVSCKASGAACTTNAQCCTGLCNNGAPPGNCN